MHIKIPATLVLIALALAALFLCNCESIPPPTGASEEPISLNGDENEFGLWCVRDGKLRNLCAQGGTDNIYINASFTNPPNVWQPIQSAYTVFTWTDYYISISTDDQFMAPYDSLLIGVYGTLYPLTNLVSNETQNRWKFKVEVDNGNYSVVCGNQAYERYLLSCYTLTPDSSDSFDGSILNWDMVKRYPTQILVSGNSNIKFVMVSLPLDSVTYIESRDVNGALIDIHNLTTVVNGVYSCHLNHDGTFEPWGDPIEVIINPGGP
ncbi:hypothetical protein KJ840_03060 [Patescibacteria group bacterium]|nr:hypothetical protein [Patescibacteria group bacterium]